MANPVGNKRSQAIIVQMLQLAAAADRKMLAWRRCMMWPVDKSARRIKYIARCRMRNILAVSSHAIATRGDADNLVCFSHKKAHARGGAFNQPASSVGASAGFASGPLI